ncbi:unnamed protein product, partial [Ectocarpus sp. 12 AP-2014]
KTLQLDKYFPRYALRKCVAGTMVATWCQAVTSSWHLWCPASSRPLRHRGRSHLLVPRSFMALQHPLHSCVAVTPLHLDHILLEKDEGRRARRGAALSVGL